MKDDWICCKGTYFKGECCPHCGTRWFGMDDDWKKMKIIAAACYRTDIEMIFTLPPPARHHNILHAMHELGIPQDSRVEQGFLTDTGEFVMRKPALLIAENAGQMKRVPGGYNGPELFSEDLW